ncbi:MAG: hypothetical protein ACREXW_18205 [Gammaproteobacteria bacterium]
MRRAGRIQVLTQEWQRRSGPCPTAGTRPRTCPKGSKLFCTGIQGHFFNREGRAWPRADITILELGLLAREGYEDSLACAYTSIMSHIQDLVERHQRDGRATIVVNDERI